MTREEAIEILKQFKKCLADVVFDEKGSEAWQMAIQALSQEPSDELISREELLKAIDTWDKFGCDADTKLVRYQDHYVPYIQYDDVIKCIKGMPPVTQKSGRWIPVSERLPEDEQEILFSTKTGRVHSGKYHDDDSANQWYSHRDKCRAWNNVVTAWMPLPESYKAESEEQTE